MTTDSVDLARIRAETCLAHIEHHSELPSTNDRALALALELSLPRPALVIAEHQTAGRGRANRRWQSSPGGLTFSLVLDRPDRLPLERLPLVSLVAGLATCRAIESVAPMAVARVKWPNDVYLQGRKLAGILTEIASAASSRLVIGIGLNANNPLADGPEGVRAAGISLAEYLGREVDRTNLLVALLVALELALERLAQSGELDVAEWSARCLLTGRDVAVRTERMLTSGRCRGVGPDGRLWIEAGERISRLSAGEVVSW